MSNPMKVVIGYDGSAGADLAIRDLERAGLPSTTEATVITAADLWYPPPPEGIDSLSAASSNLPASSVVKESQAAATAILEEAKRLAEEGAEKVRQRFPSWQVSSKTDMDSPAWAIVQEADDWHADLIVVAPNRGSSLRGLFLGSVSQLVVSEAHCSVRVARGQGAEPGRPLRLVVSFDGSAQAEAAVRAVAEREWPANSDVRLITAIDPKMHPVTQAQMEQAQGAQAEGEELEDYAVATMHEIVEQAAATLRKLAPSLSVSTFVKVGAPKQVILEEAERWGADCIFVGARGLNLRARFLLGSVSSAIATRAHCSVEVIRPPLPHSTDATATESRSTAET